MLMYDRIDVSQGIDTNKTDSWQVFYLLFQVLSHNQF